jgi:hypothetical protein
VVPSKAEMLDPGRYNLLSNVFNSFGKLDASAFVAPIVFHQIFSTDQSSYDKKKAIMFQQLHL